MENLESGLESEYDYIFNELSQQIESSSSPLGLQESHTSTEKCSTEEFSSSVVIPQPEKQPISTPLHLNSNFPPKLGKKLRPFSEVKSDKEVELARASGIPQSTQKDTKYCIGLWDAWVSHRAEANGDTFGELSKEELNYWLTRFILEVNKINELYFCDACIINNYCVNRCGKRIRLNLHPIPYIILCVD